MSTKNLVLCALMAALLCVLAPLAIPLSGGVPLSLATFAVMLAGTLIDHKLAALSALIYLLIGSMGLPVFSNYTAGLSVLVGPTGGYLIGYIPLAYCTGLFIQKEFSITKLIAGILLGTLILYGLGTMWFVFVTQTSFVAALSLCVFPFIPGDGLKILLVCLLGPTLRKRIQTI